MDPFTELLSVIRDEIKKNEAKTGRPINHSFCCEQDAFAYFRSVAKLQPGSHLEYLTSHGRKHGIFLMFNDHGMPIVFGWENGSFTSCAISPMCLVLECEDDMEDDELSEFHRT